MDREPTEIKMTTASLLQFAKDMRHELAVIPGWGTTKSKVMWNLYGYLNGCVAEKDKIKELLNNEFSNGSAGFTNESVIEALRKNAFGQNINSNEISLLTKPATPEKKEVDKEDKKKEKTTEDTLAMSAVKIKNALLDNYSIDKELSKARAQVMWTLYIYLDTVIPSRKRIEQILEAEFAKSDVGFTEQSITQIFDENQIPKHKTLLQLAKDSDKLATNHRAATFQEIPFELDLTAYSIEKRDQKLILAEENTLAEISQKRLIIQDKALNILDSTDPKEILSTVMRELGRGSKQEVNPKLYAYIQNGLHSRGFLGKCESIFSATMIEHASYLLNNDSATTERSIAISLKSDSTFEVTEECHFFSMQHLQDAERPIIGTPQQPLFTLRSVSTIKFNSKNDSVDHEISSCKVTSALVAEGYTKNLVKALRENPTDPSKWKKTTEEKDVKELKKKDQDRQKAFYFYSKLDEAIKAIEEKNELIPPTKLIERAEIKAAKNKQKCTNILTALYPLILGAETVEQVEEVFRAADKFECMHKPAEADRIFPEYPKGKIPFSGQKRTSLVMFHFAEYCQAKIALFGKDPDEDNSEEAETVKVKETALGSYVNIHHFSTTSAPTFAPAGSPTSPSATRTQEVKVKGLYSSPLMKSKLSAAEEQIDNLLKKYEKGDAKEKDLMQTAEFIAAGLATQAVGISCTNAKVQKLYKAALDANHLKMAFKILNGCANFLRKGGDSSVKIYESQLKSILNITNTAGQTLKKLYPTAGEYSYSKMLGQNGIEEGNSPSLVTSFASTLASSISETFRSPKSKEKQKGSEQEEIEKMQPSSPLTLTNSPYEEELR